jgi:hypothetical protein
MQCLIATNAEGAEVSGLGRRQPLAFKKYTPSRTLALPWVALRVSGGLRNFLALQITRR